MASDARPDHFEPKPIKIEKLFSLRGQFALKLNGLFPVSTEASMPDKRNWSKQGGPPQAEHSS